MSSLVLYTWLKHPTIIDKNNADIATICRYGEKVFVYGQPATSGSIDKTNIGILLKRFGQAKIYKKNLMAVNHSDAIDKNKVDGVKSFNRYRIEAIELINNEFAEFFLTQLHNLTWKNYADGV